jgi:ankyrin repeat protein
MKLNPLLCAILLATPFCAEPLLAQTEQNLAKVVSNGDRDQAFLLLDNDADANTQLSDHSSALLYAAYQGDEELVKALLDAGADPNIRNDYGAFALSEAAQTNAHEIVKLLLDHQADPNLGNLEGETALMVAARSGARESAELLLKHGADINTREQWGGQTAVMWAAAQSQPEMLELLIKYDADVNLFGYARLWDRRIMNEPRPKDMNKGGFSPLLYAAREGCTACIPILAKAGADLNGVDPDRTSALNVALMNLHFDTAMALIDAGADVNQWDIFGQAPLFNAIDMNTLPIGGRADIPSEDLTTALDVAKVLLEKGANPNMQLKVRPPYRNAVFDRGSDGPLSEGATPLFRAARAADNAAIQLLLDHGALVDLANARGHTPLLAVAGIDWAAEPTRGRYKTEEASIDTIRLLLEHGADINTLTGDPARRPHPTLDHHQAAPEQPANARGPVDHQNALHAAAKLGWTKIAQFLIDNGIEQQVVDTSGKTPFDFAMGRYQSNAPILPNLAMARLLQRSCEAAQGCNIKDPLPAEQMAEK